MTSLDDNKTVYRMLTILCDLIILVTTAVVVVAFVAFELAVVSAAPSLEIAAISVAFGIIVALALLGKAALDRALKQPPSASLQGAIVGVLVSLLFPLSSL